MSRVEVKKGELDLIWLRNLEPGSELPAQFIKCVKTNRHYGIDVNGFSDNPWKFGIYENAAQTNAF